MHSKWYKILRHFIYKLSKQTEFLLNEYYTFLNLMSIFELRPPFSQIIIKVILRRYKQTGWIQLTHQVFKNVDEMGDDIQTHNLIIIRRITEDVHFVDKFSLFWLEL